MNHTQRIAEENMQLHRYIYRLLNEPEYYLSQSVMKGELKKFQNEIFSGKVKSIKIQPQ